MDFLKRLLGRRAPDADLPEPSTPDVPTGGDEPSPVIQTALDVLLDTLPTAAELPGILQCWEHFPLYEMTPATAEVTFTTAGWRATVQGGGHDIELSAVNEPLSAEARHTAILYSNWDKARLPRTA
ncbi:hypothetical protein [Deinococcus sp.]|uniref:hypothetical protein n=1 Tax=Deinococcus sp. TaxID=47478 RepID=UPI0028699D5C|nr:hypothetical protein [Deinococcus sp.]